MDQCFGSLQVSSIWGNMTLGQTEKLFIKILSNGPKLLFSVIFCCCYQYWVELLHLDDNQKVKFYQNPETCESLVIKTSTWFLKN